MHLNTIFTLVPTIAIALGVFTPVQKIRTKGGNELEFDSVEPNKIQQLNTAIALGCAPNNRTETKLKRFQMNSGTVEWVTQWINDLKTLSVVLLTILVHL